MGGSEVAQFRQQIADQYQAAQWGFSGLTSGASRHQFITHKMENLGGIFEQLTQIVESKHIAIEIVSETIEALPETPTRIQFTHILWRVLGDTDVKETRVLLDSLEGMWKTIDMLKERFGHERAQKIIALPLRVIAEEGAHE